MVKWPYEDPSQKTKLLVVVDGHVVFLLRAKGDIAFSFMVKSNVNSI